MCLNKDITAVYKIGSYVYSSLIVQSLLSLKVKHTILGFSPKAVLMSLFVTTIMQLLAGTWVKGQQGMVQSQPACILQWCSIQTTGKALCICAERRALCHATRTAALTTASNQPQPYWHSPARWMPAEEQGLSFIGPVLAGSILVPFRWSVGIC